MSQTAVFTVGRQFQSGRPSLRRTRASRAVLSGPTTSVVPPVIRVKLPATYSQSPSMSMARTSLRPLGHDVVAIQLLTGAPVVGSSAASPEVLTTPFTLVNSPPTKSLLPSGEASSFHTGASITGLNVGIHSPVSLSNAARYDWVNVGPPRPCCTWRNLPPT